MKQLFVHYLPAFVAEHELAGGTVVVIDLLRASSTICTALANGAAEVRPFVEVDATLRAADGQKRAEILLGGERRGERICGFDLGNSPEEYTPDRVFGKRILFTTTNGTRALEHARLAQRIVIGAIVNLSAVADSMCVDTTVHVLCAGTNGHVTREDILAAGALAERLAAKSAEWEFTDPAEAARREWLELENAARAAGRSLAAQLAAELCRTSGGKNLLAIGHDHDLVACAQIDSLHVAPEYDPATGRITLP